MPYLRGSIYKRKPQDNLQLQIKRLERKVAGNRGELKQEIYSQGVGTAIAATGGFYIQNLTDIGVGVADNNRIGNNIKVDSVRCNVYCSNSRVACYLVVAPQGITPTVASFGNSTYPQVTPAQTEDVKILKFLHNFNSVNQALIVHKRWRNGLHVKYNTPVSTDLNQNALFLVLINNSSSAETFDFNCTTYFRDN